jgi:hypothetical protein
VINKRPPSKKVSEPAWHEAYARRASKLIWSSSTGTTTAQMRLGSHAGLAGRELLSSTMAFKYLTSNVIGGLDSGHPRLPARLAGVLSLLGVDRQGNRSRADALGAGRFSLLVHPASHGLVIVQGPWHGHVRLDVAKADALQCAIRRHVEGIGLAE